MNKCGWTVKFKRIEQQTMSGYFNARVPDCSLFTTPILLWAVTRLKAHPLAHKLKDRSTFTCLLIKEQTLQLLLRSVRNPYNYYVLMTINTDCILLSLSWVEQLRRLMSNVAGGLVVHKEDS